LRVANYMIRLAVLNAASDAIGAANQNAKLVREGAAKHSVSLSQCLNDSTNAGINVTKLKAELNALQSFRSK
jgi:hypothetical protein